MEERLLEMGRAYQPACVILAAAELDLYGALTDGAKTAGQLAEAIGGDLRATTYLADALVALGLLEKNEGVYKAGPEALQMLTVGGSTSVVPMLRHQANCLRSWAQLAAVVRSGLPYDRPPSIEGESADRTSFIEAMNVASRAAAPRVVAAMGPPAFDHLLDVGCGPGTWTIAFLSSRPWSRATLLDLPEVLPITRSHIEAKGLIERVEFTAGDYLADETLPRGADLAWVSAIAHQNSRQQNRELFAKLHAALVPG
jgi:hypothetical protein